MASFLFTKNIISQIGLILPNVCLKSSCRMVLSDLKKAKSLSEMKINCLMFNHCKKICTFGHCSHTLDK